MTVTPHALPHAVALSGVQHVPSLMQVWPLGHAVVLFTPQLTVRLQLSVTWPHCRFPQLADWPSGTQPHACAVHVPPSHPPQSIPLLQLSTVLPHRPLHQSTLGTHTQRFWALQVSPGSHPLQVTICPQLSGPVPQCVSHQSRSDEHRLPDSPSVPVSPESAESPGASLPASPMLPSLATSLVASSLADVSAGASTVASSPPVPPPSPELEPSTTGVPGSMPKSAPQPAAEAAAASTISAAKAGLRRRPRIPLPMVTKFSTLERPAAIEGSVAASREVAPT